MACSSTVWVLVLYHLVIAALCQSSQCPDSPDGNVFIDIFNQAIIESESTLLQAPIFGGVDRSTPAYEFSGTRSGITLTRLSDTIKEASCSHNEVTFTGRVFIQNSQSYGPLLEVSYGAGLEAGLIVYVIMMDAGANEILLGYRHRGRLHSEAIPVRLISGRWRDYAITLSGNLLTFYFDCALITQRLVPLPDYCADSPPSIVVNVASSISGGEEFAGKKGLSVFMQKVGIHFGLGGLKRQCPETPTLCPTCGQYLSVLEDLTLAKEEVQRLQQIIDNGAGLAPPTAVPSPGGTSCGFMYMNERYVIENRQFGLLPPNRVCYCDNGNEACINIDSISIPLPSGCTTTTATATVGVSNPTVTPAQQEPCTLGDVTSVKTGINTCGVSTCEDFGFGPIFIPNPHTCSVERSRFPNCASEYSKLDQEIAICCGFCNPCNFTQCPENNNCVLQDAGTAVCVCNKGFFRNSATNNTCVDTDECALGRGPNGHNCPGTSNCINTIGSFFCVCKDGFRQGPNNNFGSISCEDINECVESTHTCNLNISTCMNTVGNYVCDCIEGYTRSADGHACNPICDVACQNGGFCSSPNTCTCTSGYTGSYCENDIDECESPELNACGENKMCINTIGGYFCRCPQGYKEEGSKCIDVDECATRIHNCIGSSTCVNTAGSFKCICQGNTGSTGCTGACVLRGKQYNNGQVFSHPGDGCRTCTCLDGEITCRRILCNCSREEDRNNQCCPQCRIRYCFLKNGTVSIRPDNSWVNPENRCERYNCKRSGDQLVATRVDVTCSNLSCPEDLQSIPAGKCCPVCMMPTCDASLEGRTVTLRSACKWCTCENSTWTCRTQDCPEANCAPTDVVFYRDGCCPVCRQQVLGTENTQCFTSV